MIKTRYQARQLLLTLLIILVSIILGLSLYYVIDDHIKLINTWQYNATYDFEKEIETTQDGKNTLVCNVNSAEQLAGAFAFPNQITPEGMGGSGSIDKENPDNGLTIDYSTMNGIKNIDTTHIRLISNVDLEGKHWVPVELNSEVVFDGNGFCIKNLTIDSNADNLGFISINNGTIKNLVFVNADITNTDTTQKATANGVTAGINNGLVENVTVISGSVYANADGEQNNDRRAGGIVGLNNSENAIVRYCSNYATIGRAKFSGGIVGFQGNGLIEYCYNYGNISCSCNIYPRMGGICAEAKEGTVQYCINSGEIKDLESKVSKDFRAGGILGMQLENVTLQYCGNYGNVLIGNIESNKTYSGGIVGYSKNNISNCYNRGKVTAFAKFIDENGVRIITEPKKYNIYEKSEWGVFTYKEFKFSLNVYTPSASRYVCEYAYAGGIAGKALKIDNCYSIGNVRGGILYKYIKTQISIISRFVANVIVGGDKNAVVEKEFYYYQGLYADSICPYVEAINCYYNGTVDYLKPDIFSFNSGKLMYYQSGSFGVNILPQEPNTDEKIGSYTHKQFWNDLSDDIYDLPECSVELRVKTTETGFEYYFKPIKGNKSLKDTTIFSDSLNTYVSLAQKIEQSELKQLEMGEGWNINLSKNDGYPYIEGLYW